MRVALARRLHGLPGLGCGFLDGDIAENLREHLGRNRTRAQYRGSFSRERYDGAFYPDAAGAAGGGAHVLEEVRARGCKREARFLDDRLRHGVAREPYRDGREAARAKVGDAVLLGKDDGHGPGPVGLGELVGAVGNVFRDVGQLCDIRDMHDERVEGRAFLGGKNFSERSGLERVARKSVDGFCRDGDDFACLEQARRFRNTCPWRELHYGTKIEKGWRLCHP